MDYGKADKLKTVLNSLIREKGFDHSFAKTLHLKSDDSYEVRIVVHPSEENIQGMLPPSLNYSPWEGDTGSGKEYVKRTPYTPSQNKDTYFFSPSPTRRKHDGPQFSPDVNPAYPGLRRIPELQDLVRRVAMRPDLKARLETVYSKLEPMKRLMRLAKVGHGFRTESEYLVSELSDQLKEDGYNGRHKIVRLTKKLKTSLEKDGYSF